MVLQIFYHGWRVFVERSGWARKLKDSVRSFVVNKKMCPGKPTDGKPRFPTALKKGAVDRKRYFPTHAMLRSLSHSREAVFLVAHFENVLR